MRIVGGWLVGCLIAIAAPCWGQEASPEALQAVFQRLLENPSDVALNFRYAELALQQNRLRSALAAYERVLATDPNNEEAKAGVRRIQQLLEPEFTSVTVTLGGQYESNPRLAGAGRPAGDAAALIPQAEVVDERRVGSLRLRSEGDVVADFYKRFSDLNYGKANANTGPVLSLGDWQVRPALGFGYAWLNGNTFYDEATSLLTLAPPSGGPLRRINLQFSYDWIARSIAPRDAFQIEVAPQLYWVNQFTDQDTILVTPFYRFNGVNGSGPPGSGVGGQPFPLQSHQVGGRIDYYVALFGNFAIDANFTGYYQPYNQTVTNGTSERHDRYLSPGLQLILKEFPLTRADLVLGYQYEDNGSNDPAETFTNHIVSLRSVWRF